MRFLSPSRLRIASFVLMIVILCVTLGYVGKVTFASHSLLTGSQMPTVVFSGHDTSGYSELWATTGTAGGTTKLTNITTGTYYGLAPYDITPFGKQALFNETDASNLSELWTTDGTITGTKEITTATTTGNLNPYNITVIGNQAVFTGYGANGKTSLWVTDGTGAGTHELMIANTACAWRS